jgi:hypothetical protein
MRIYSTQNGLEDFSMHVRQASIQAIVTKSQFGMIDTEQV